MPGRGRAHVALAASLVLAGCTGERAGGVLNIEITADKSVEALSVINENAQKCWFRSGDRAFRGLAVIPELDTRIGNPRLLVVERGKSTGLPKLVIEASGDPVKITTFGPLASQPISARINDDVIAWSGGRSAC
ncbi:hypothetical protein [Oricola indica]|uniref:hypothetical protein n=1 Tax=Oricola indica TaxID=2872591 RepID=UPI003CCBC32B